jgi:outer membrane protein OmpA-like peptidoglycan-associated protein
MRAFFSILLFSIAWLSTWGQANSITALVIDDGQNIYVGSNSGVSKMDAENRQMTHILDGISVVALAWSKRQGLYVACNGNEIWTVEGNKILTLDDPGVEIRCMMISGSQLWVGTNTGVYVISLNRQEISAHHTTQNSVLVSDHINTMYADGSGIKWIGTEHGVVRIEGERKWKLYEQGTRFTAIAGNSEGAWLAGDTEMWLVDQFNRWTPTNVKFGLSVGEMRSVATDKHGRVYLLSDIFVQFDPYEDVIVPIEVQEASVVAQNVALAIDNNDQLWIATSLEGLKMIDPETSISNAPLLATLIVRHPSCAGAQDGSIEIRVQGGQPPYEYFWDDQRLTGSIERDLSAGSYEVIVLDHSGAEYTDATALLEPEAMQVLISEDPTSEGFTLVARASGGRGDFAYQWSNGSKTRRAAIESAGTYTVTVTDINGCTAQTAYALNESVFTTPSIDIETPVVQSEGPLEVVTVENIKELKAGELIVGQVLRIEQLFFQADSSSIVPQSYAILDGIYDFLRANENIVIEIGGHTNGLPDHEYCDRLSTARAKSVAEYIYNKGIPDERIIYHGYGKREPIATNETIEGRRKNQRVEVKILQM